MLRAIGRPRQTCSDVRQLTTAHAQARSCGHSDVYAKRVYAEGQAGGQQRLRGGQLQRRASRAAHARHGNDAALAHGVGGKLRAGAGAAVEISRPAARPVREMVGVARLRRGDAQSSPPQRGHIRLPSRALPSHGRRQRVSWERSLAAHSDSVGARAVLQPLRLAGGGSSAAGFSPCLLARAWRFTSGGGAMFAQAIHASCCQTLHSRGNCLSVAVAGQELQRRLQALLVQSPTTMFYQPRRRRHRRSIYKPIFSSVMIPEGVCNVHAPQGSAFTGKSTPPASLLCDTRFLPPHQPLSLHFHRDNQRELSSAAARTCRPTAANGRLNSRVDKRGGSQQLAGVRLLLQALGQRQQHVHVHLWRDGFVRLARSSSSSSSSSANNSSH
jgi:hypothetical protein